MQDMPTTPFGLPFISFVVIILTFFVFLNAHAILDPQREQFALDGLEKAFPNKVHLLFRMKGKRLAPIDARELPALKERAAAAGYSVEATGSRVILTASSASLFASANDQLLAGAFPLLQQIAAYMHATKPVLTIVVVSAAEDDGHEQSFAVALSRAQTLHRVFIDAGAPVEKLQARAWPAIGSSPSRTILVLDPEPRPFIPVLEEH